MSAKSPRSLLLLRLSGCSALVVSFSTTVLGQPDPDWLAHDRLRPLPAVVEPGTASQQAQPGRPPSDAVVLFDGDDISQWVSMDGSPTKWVVGDGYMECVRGSGYIRTLRNFGDCQLHVEYATPAQVEGKGQGRGNSGLFFGGGQYEVQVLDSFANTTYADGSAGSAYGQYPPLVNASRPPGQWQWYDVIWTSPRFSPQGDLLSPARLTVFHNGVLIQNHVELTGPTGWLERAPYRPHPVKMPISLQDHGNPVRYRNIWVRELGRPGKPEYTLPSKTLASYAGKYDRSRDEIITITPADGRLHMEFHGVKFVLFAESETRFFAKTTDVQIEFQRDGSGKVTGLVGSVGEDPWPAKKVR